MISRNSLKEKEEKCNYIDVFKQGRISCIFGVNVMSMKTRYEIKLQCN